jgi:hypothetical protein
MPHRETYSVSPRPAKVTPRPCQPPSAICRRPVGPSCIHGYCMLYDRLPAQHYAFSVIAPPVNVSMSMVRELSAGTAHARWHVATAQLTRRPDVERGRICWHEEPEAEECKSMCCVMHCRTAAAREARTAKWCGPCRRLHQAVVLRSGATRVECCACVHNLEHLLNMVSGIQVCTWVSRLHPSSAATTLVNSRSDALVSTCTDCSIIHKHMRHLLRQMRCRPTELPGTADCELTQAHGLCTCTPQCARAVDPCLRQPSSCCCFASSRWQG